MIWKKRMIALLCAAALSLSLLAGCSSDKDVNPQDSVTSNDNVQNVNDDVPEVTTPETILWINATHAVLTDLNGWDYTKFGGMDATDANKEMMIPFLEDWWGVTDRDSAVETIDWLLAEGHRADFVALMQLLDEDGWADSSEEEVAAMLTEVFEDEDAGKFTAQAYTQYHTYGETCIDGWDYSRALSLLGWFYIAGYYTETEALDKALEIAKELQGKFSSWDELIESYMRGYEYWSEASADARRNAYEDIKGRTNSPYKADWNAALEKSW